MGESHGGVASERGSFRSRSRAWMPWLLHVPESIAPQLEEGFRRHVLQTLRIASLALCILFGVFALAHPFTLSPAEAAVMMPLALASALAFLLLHLQLAREEIDSIYAHDLAGAAFAVVLINGLAHLALTGEAYQTTNLMLAMLAAGMVFLSWRWLAVSAGMTLGAWATIAWRVASPGSEWTHFGFGLGSAILLSFVVFASRVNSLERYEAVRLLDERHAQELAESLRSRRESEERLRMLVAGAPVMLLSLDADGRITLVEGRALEALALRATQAVGRPFADVFAGHEGLISSATRALEGETFESIDAWGGRTFEMRWTPLGPAPGEVAQVVCVATDITRRLQAEDQRLRDAARLRELESLEEMDAFKTRFLNVAAHELRTPLTPIKLQLHVLKSRIAALGDDGAERSLGVVERNLGQLGDVVESIVAASLLHAGQLGIAREPVDLGTLVQEAVEAERERALGAGVRIHLLKEDVAPVAGDAVWLGEVVRSLVENAVKFSPPGNAVDVRVRQVAREVVVEIHDRGVGFAQEDLDKLFRPFAQLHDAMDRTRAGQGLNLFIARGILDLHRGRVWAESVGPGEGATFAFALPVKSDD